MTDHEKAWDAALRIQTCGRDALGADEYRHPYEPTPYRVLERLAASGLVGKDRVILDYGCGKGRVGFFLAHRTKAKTIGIEYDQRIYRAALANQKTALSRIKPVFALARAEEYPVPPEVNGCYFFHPFSVEILSKVIPRILASWYAQPRELFLFFYYPPKEYLSYLMTVEELAFYDELPCEDLFGGKDPRERIVIFHLPHYGQEG